MEFQLITEEQNCPYRLSITKGSTSETHFHSSLELIFVLRGGIIYTLAGTSYTLSPRDFIFSNPYEIHAITQVAEDTNLIQLEIELQPFKPLFPSDSPLFFQWDETYNNRALEFYREITASVRTILTDAINQEPTWLARINQEIISILIAIYRHCERPAHVSKRSSRPVDQTQKAAEIMEYLNTHYMDPLSLQTVSQAIHLSPPYISRLFKETFHVGFLEYLNHLRIQKSLRALESSSEYILDIAVSVGFNSAKSYRRVFQQIMGITPTEYRNQHTAQTDLSLSRESQTEPMAHLLRFISETNFPPQDSLTEKKYDIIAIQQDFTSCVYKKNPRKWNRTLSIGMAALLLQRTIQQSILDAVRDMGFQYVRFTGVLSDNLQIYQENADGTPVYFWVLLDEILDFLLRNNLKPFICLGFMPERLAARAVPSPYLWNANTSKPKSLQQWTDYLHAFLQHCVNRYSYEEVSTWKFEFWNAPELQGLFWHDTDREFEQFFLASYRTFRSVLPNGLWGSPGFVKFHNFAHTRKFLEFCRKNQVHFDFICLHIFMVTDPSQNDPLLTKILSLGPDQDIQETRYLNHAVSEIAGILADLRMETPIYITEWNISPYFHDLSRDTCFMSTYITDTINQLPDEVEEISFWALTDYMQEHVPHQDMFTGELGIMTHNGLPKPSYLAFILLHRMEENLVASGDCYFITASNNSCQIMLYNYAFYSEEFLKGENRNLTELNRYQIYEQTNKKQFQLHLTLSPGTYRIEHHVLNREHGSVYDHWIHMGTPKHIDQATYYCLHNKAYPDINVHHQTVEEHLLLSELVPVHGVELILLTKVE
ncbi:MAG: helix-turn-helix domain-containing protein [Clostridiales bacterium]|nr:helix-turn-helix domain-containing protein [Clostridiales bacterium]